MHKKFILYALVALFCSGVPVTAHASTDLPTGDVMVDKDVESFKIQDSDTITYAPRVRGSGTSVTHGIHYGMLKTTAEKILYDGFYTAATTNLKGYDYEYPEGATIDYLEQEATLIYNGTLELKYDDYVLSRVMEAIYYDHPDMVELYMSSPSLYYTPKGKDGHFKVYVIQKAQSRDYANYSLYDAQIRANANRMASEVKATYTAQDDLDAEKILKAHDYYITKVTYDYNCLNLQGNDAFFHYSHTAYGALCKKSAVCDGYSAGYRMLLKELGFSDCFIVVGLSGNSGGGHAWNMVRLDDKQYYEEDTTWADTAYTHEFFNKTTEQYRSHPYSSHIRSEYVGIGAYLPEAMGTKYTYEYLSLTGMVTDNSGYQSDSSQDSSKKNETTSPSEVPGSKFVVSGGEAILVDVTSTGSFSIPEKVSAADGKTYKVTEIADDAFRNNRGITSITGGKNLKRIGKRALKGCTRLKKVDIRNSNVTVIDSAAFDGCSSLKNIYLNGDKIKKIKKNAFRDVPSKAKYKIKARSAKKYSQVVKKIKASGVKKGKFKRIK